MYTRGSLFAGVSVGDALVKYFFGVVFLCLSLFGEWKAMASPDAAQKLDPTLLTELRWRSIGPARGGRTLAVTGVRGQPEVFYFGAVGGGVWRSNDAGRTWKPIFDSQGIASIGAIAVAPSNPQIIYVGTGEADMRSDISNGNGMYRSADGGKTWTHIGLEESRQVARILVEPQDPEKVIVEALGLGYGPIADAKEGGLYRSDDGGENWQRVSDDKRIWGRGWYFCEVSVDSKDADTVYVPNTGLYRSRDGGKTFTAIKGAPGGDDYHQLWIDPDEPQRMILGSDQGTVVTRNGGESLSSWYNQPTGQFYHVATDNRFPYWVYGAQQDSGSE